MPRYMTNEDLCATCQDLLQNLVLTCLIAWLFAGVLAANGWAVKPEPQLGPVRKP
jgi:hypothetical protein